MKTIALLLSVVLAAPAGAIELSLEENRAERGNIGYIDMTKLFRQFPETVRAKENFEEILRQTEDQVNLRKVEILKARNELSQLRMEREIMAKTILPMQIEDPKKKAKDAAKAGPKVETTPAPTPAPAPQAQSPSPAPTPAEADLAAMRASEQAAAQAAAAQPGQDLSQLPGLGGQPAAPAPAPADSLVINIPGVSTAPVVVQAPEAEPTAAAAQPSPAPEIVAASTEAAKPAVVEAPKPDAPSPNAALAELDAKIALRTRELAAKEADFKKYQGEQEKNLLDLESRKTEVLLGKIHRAVQEVARREGVSVVVDKTSILYGHDAVDLTEKVLKFLRGT